MKKWIKRIIKLATLSILLSIIITYCSNYWVKKSTQKQHYNQITKIPTNKVGVVLGTSKHVVSGHINMYFKNRMEAAAQLYKNKKIKYLIVSGDNSIKEYNETRDMKNYLIKLGVPAENIIEDFAGFRTLDSVVRAKKVFGLDSITIISQQFHNERALFIANNHDIYAVAFNAKNVSANYGFRTNIREYLARVKAVLDIYILGTMPKFYKEKEKLPNL